LPRWRWNTLAGRNRRLEYEITTLEEVVAKSGVYSRREIVLAASQFDTLRLVRAFPADGWRDERN
jgi:hypothetical protein